MWFFHWIQFLNKRNKQLLARKFHDQHKALCYKFKKTTSLEEVDLQYASIWSWCYSLGTTNKGTIHKLNNQISFWHFCVRQWGGFMLDVSSSKVLYSTFIFHLSFLNSNFIPFMCLQKFSLEEEADMSTCNLSETIHKIQLQQFGKRCICLFVTSNDYVQAFKQSSLYYAFLQGGASWTNLDKNESQLHKASQFGDLVQIVAIVVKHTSSFGPSPRILHLEGEEVFGSAKDKTYLPHGSIVDSHQDDWVNFFCPKMVNATTTINQSSTMDVGETNGLVPTITYNGAKVLECLCGESIWRIQ